MVIDGYRINGYLIIIILQFYCLLIAVKLVTLMEHSM